MRQKSRSDSPSADVISPMVIEALRQSSRRIPILVDVIDVALTLRHKVKKVKTSKQKALVLLYRLFKTLETLAEAAQSDPCNLPPHLYESISSFKDLVVEIDSAMASLTKWKTRLKLGSKRNEEVLETFIQRLDQACQSMMNRSSQADSSEVQREDVLSPTQNTEMGSQHPPSPSILPNRVKSISNETQNQNGANMFEQSRDFDIDGGNFYSAGRDVHMRITQTRSILSVEEKLLRLERDVSYENTVLHNQIHFLWLQSTVLF